MTYFDNGMWLNLDSPEPFTKEVIQAMEKGEVFTTFSHGKPFQRVLINSNGVMTAGGCGKHSDLSLRYSLPPCPYAPRLRIVSLSMFSPVVDLADHYSPGTYPDVLRFDQLPPTYTAELADGRMVKLRPGWGERAWRAFALRRNRLM